MLNQSIFIASKNNNKQNTAIVLICLRFRRQEFKTHDVSSQTVKALINLLKKPRHLNVFCSKYYNSVSTLAAMPESVNFHILNVRI